MRAGDEVATSPPSSPLLNRIMSRVLRSPLSALVDRGILLLRVFGRRTGHPYTFPVQYVQEGEELWIYAGEGREKTWWRNLGDGAPVEVLIRRRRRSGTGVASTYDRQPEVVEGGLRRYVERFPRAAKRLGISLGDGEVFGQVAARSVVVRIRFEGDSGQARRRDETIRPASNAPDAHGSPLRAW